MYPAKYIFTVSDITFYQCKMMFSCNIIDISVKSEISILRRKVCNRFFFYMFFMDSHVILKITDRNKCKIMLFCKFPQLWCTHHCAIFFHNLTTHAAFFQSSQSHQISRCLCVSVPHQDSAFSGNEWKYMSRSSEIFRLRIFIHTFHDCIGTFCCRNTCRRINMVHCNGKCCAVIIGILRNHRWKVKPCCNFRTHRCTDKPFRISRHKIDILLCCKLCCTYQIPFVLSVRIICNQNNLSFPQIP